MNPEQKRPDRISENALVDPCVPYLSAHPSRTPCERKSLMIREYDFIVVAAALAEGHFL